MRPTASRLALLATFAVFLSCDGGGTEPGGNRAPVATITAPATTTTFRGGEHVAFAGSGTDPEDGEVPAVRLAWWADLHHDTHTHPAMARAEGIASGTFPIPPRGETSPNIFYRVYLEVRDAAGRADTTFRDVQPQRATMRFETQPAGLQLTLDGQPQAAPFEVVGVAGMERDIGAPLSQVVGSTRYELLEWTHGGMPSQTIVTPSISTVYVARYEATAPANQLPVVTLTAPAEGAVLTLGAAATMRATATDADGNVVSVTFVAGGTQLGSDGASPYEITWTPMSTGSLRLIARARDDGGGEGADTVFVSVQQAGGGDQVPPVAQLTAPANDARNLTGAVALRATATDDVGVVGVTFQVDGETVGAEDTSAPYEVTLPATGAYTSGQHVVRARARDAAGNVSAWATATVQFGGTVALPAGFTRTTYVSGILPATTMAWSPDGRLFIAQQGGALRVVKNGALLATPFHTFDTQWVGERGLLGVTFDPALATNGFVYAYYTARSPERNIVVRLTANGDVSVPGSETVLLELPPLTSATNHNGGALHFGPDGKLYVAVGDNAVAGNAPLLTSPMGKILRINADGTIPADNPFFGQTTGTSRAIWARGLRNPFTFGFRPGTGRMLINDVGQNEWEEVNEGVAGADYGWPATEGYTTNAQYRSPLFAYPHPHVNAIVRGASVVGAAFYDPPTATFPASYVGDFFFGDYVSSWVARLDLDNGNAVYTFALLPGGMVDVRTGPDGALYVLGPLTVNGAWGVWRIAR